MGIEAGQSLLHYRIVEKVGEGGMGVVWKATDTTLDRVVAIKLLPDAFAADPDRLARFEREAKLLASLNHPNVAAIHSVHGRTEAGGAERRPQFLAMEWVDGEDLAQRIARGPLQLDDALAIARQVAEALRAAHASGVVHRDLKPANVKVTGAGLAKVLDFGLAKALVPEPPSGSTSNTMSPTMTSAGTVAGVILGTASYMSPEQARGRAVDRRADLWAFGCLLYEMLTGRRPFGGETISDTLAAVLRAEPDWGALPAGTPRGIRRLLRRCLEKSADRRLHDAADARIEIDESIEGDAEAPAAAGAAPSRRRSLRLAWTVAAVAAVVAVAAIVTSPGRGTRRAAEQPVHVSVGLPADLELMAGSPGSRPAAISPDGRTIVFAARKDDTTRLHLRSLGSSEFTVVPDSVAGGDPFFSPDGRWIGFTIRGKLVKASVQGGAPIELADTPTSRGAAWLDDGTIVYAPSYTSGLMRIGGDGGEPAALTTPDPERNERTHRWPSVIDGGRGVLFTIGSLDHPGYYEDAKIAVLDLATGKHRVLIEGGSMALWSPTGHVIYGREGTLLAVPFDAKRLELTGPPSPVLDGVAREVTSGAVYFDVSASGTMLFLPAGQQTDRRWLIWVDREGRTERIVETSAPYLAPRLSPDNRRIAFGVGPGPGDGDIWTYDLTGGKLERFTFDSFSLSPQWTPDGKHIVYGVTRGGGEGVMRKASDGTSAGELIVRTDGRYAAVPDAWVPGSDAVAFSLAGAAGGGDVMVATLAGELQPVLDGPFLESAATFAPDGKWLAYVSDESGELEVYVQPYPERGGKWQISTGGGKGPLWSRDGTEIFYTHGNRMMAVPVRIQPTFSAGNPRELFQLDFDRAVGAWSDYDVTADGRRFLMVQRPLGDPRARQINLILHFENEAGAATQTSR